MSNYTIINSATWTNKTTHLAKLNSQNLFCSPVTLLTFINIWRKTSHKHLTGETLNALSVLVRVTVGRAKNSRDTLVAMAIIKEDIVNRKQGWAPCRERMRQMGLLLGNSVKQPWGVLNKSAQSWTPDLQQTGSISGSSAFKLNTPIKQALLH